MHVMLAYKAWRESRSRFLLSIACVAGLCAIFIVFHGLARTRPGPGPAPDDTFIGHTYLRIYAGFVRGLFLYFALLLGLGGLQRERAHHTHAFTLALPVSRLHHFGARAMVGLGQVVVLAATPALLVPALSHAVGHDYPASQSIQFAVLWIAVGCVVFAFAVFVSSVVPNEYAALAVALVGFYLYPLAVVYTPWLRGRPLHIHYIMSGRGMPYFDPATAMLRGPLPWRTLGGVTMACGVLLLAAAWMTTRQDLA
jgi:ABC-type transport system involved in multi-copper enzyme maturation permease subunit